MAAATLSMDLAPSETLSFSKISNSAENSKMEEDEEDFNSDAFDFESDADSIASTPEKSLEPSGMDVCLPSNIANFSVSSPQVRLTPVKSVSKKKTSLSEQYPYRNVGLRDDLHLAATSSNSSASSNTHPFLAPIPLHPDFKRDAIADYQRLLEDTPDYIPTAWKPDQLLDSLPWESLGSIIALGRPLDFVPTSHINVVRTVFTHCLQVIFADSTNELHWKRFLLLPTVLFINTSKNRRAALTDKCALILNDTWPFRVGDYAGRMKKRSAPAKRGGVKGPEAVQVLEASGLVDPKKKRMQYVWKLIERGEVSRAWRAVISDSTVKGYSPGALEFLRSKHPAPLDPSDWTPNSCDEGVHVATPHILMETVRSLIHTAARGASAGVDNFPIDILKQLSKPNLRKEFPPETTLFLQLLTGFINRVFVTADCPPGVLKFLDSGELVCLEQALGKIRPIGKATSYRKLSDSALQLPFRDNLRTHFKGLQYAGAAFGTERMQHSLRVHLQSQPELTYSSSDVADAYNNLNRHKILDGIEQLQPELLVPLQRRLASSQDMLFYGAEEGPVIIEARTGLQQGASTSGDLYSLAMHPLNLSLQDFARQHPAGMLSAYVDDVKAHTAFQYITDIINHQIEAGADYGSRLQMKKHKILLGRCPTEEAAIEQQRILHEKFDIPVAKIFIHPDNISDLSASVAAKSLYGDVVLGIPISPFPEFVHHQVAILTDELEAEVKTLAERLADEPQLLFYFLKHLLPHRITHFCRGLSPTFSAPLIARFTQLQRTVLCQVLDVDSIDDSSFALARIREGTGLVWAEDVPDCAYVASMVASLPAVESSNPGFSAALLDALAGNPIDESSYYSLALHELVNSVRSLDDSFQLKDHLNVDDRQLRKLQSKLLLPRKTLRREQVEAQINGNHILATIYTSGKSPEARAWLDAIPKTDATKMIASDFRTALRSRLLVPHPQLLALSKCSCGNEIDPLGIHLQKCKKSNSLTDDTHNAIVGTLGEFIRSCGCSCKEEVTGIFRNVEPADSKRMDLVVHDPSRPNILYDVVVSNAVSSKVIQGTSVNTKQCRIKELAKERYYRTHAEKAGMTFKGLAMEAHGKWGDDFHKMFKRFIAHGVVTSGIPEAILINYWRRRISMALQKGVANAINTRANRLCSRSLGSASGAGESAYEGVIEEQCEAYAFGAQIPWGDVAEELG